MTRKILLKKEVKSMMRISADSTIADLRKNHNFPLPVSLGVRRLGWYEDEVIQWIEKNREGLAIE